MSTLAQLASIQDRSDAVLAAVQYGSEMEAPGFARAVINRLGLDETRDDLLRRLAVNVDSDADIGLIQLGIQSTDPQKAQRIAKGFGDELIERKSNELFTDDIRAATRQVEQLEADLGVLRRQSNRLQATQNRTPEQQARLNSLPSEIGQLQQLIVQLRPFTQPYIRNQPSWVVQPRIPTESVTAGPLYWVLLALVVGGMAGVALAFGVEYLRRLNKIRDDRDLELATGQATLGAISEAKGTAKRADGERLVMLHYPTSDEAKAYRGLTARIGFSGGTARTLMVTSARPTDTKSLVAANIAVAYADAGRNVILVDADYRSPRIHSFFGQPNERGLTSVLTDSGVPLGWATLPSSHPRLGLMLAGPLPRENAEPLGARQLNALLRRLLQAADLVIFDAPSIEANLDAAVLADELDAAMLVVPRDSKEDATEEATRALQMAGAEFVGAVLYRTTRRSRKGTRAKVAPAPGGWGPSWHMLDEQPARIPAATLSATQRTSQPDPRTAAAPQPPRPAGPTPVQQVPARQQTGPGPGPARTSAPYGVPFRPQPVRVAPADRPTEAAPAASTPPVQRTPAAPATPAPVAIAVEPQPTTPAESTQQKTSQPAGPSTPARESSLRGSGQPPSSAQAQPESVPS